MPRAERVAALFAAFANGVGGRLVVGRRDDGSVAGVEDPQRVRDDVVAIARELVDPPVRVQVARREKDGRWIVEVDVKAADARPVRAMSAEGKYRVHVRDGSSTRRASADEERALVGADRAERPDDDGFAALRALARLGRANLGDLARSLRWSPRRTRRAAVQLAHAGSASEAADGRWWITPRGHRALARSGGSR